MKVAKPLTKPQRRRRYLLLIASLLVLDAGTGLSLLQIPDGPPKDVALATWGFATLLIMIGTFILGFAAQARK